MLFDEDCTSAPLVKTWDPQHRTQKAVGNLETFLGSIAHFFFRVRVRAHAITSTVLVKPGPFTRAEDIKSSEAFEKRVGESTGLGLGLRLWLGSPVKLRVRVGCTLTLTLTLTQASGRESTFYSAFFGGFVHVSNKARGSHV